MYIVNKAAAGVSAWVSARMALVAGFGKGSFKLAKGGEALPAGSVPFVLESSNDWVVLAGEPQTLGQAVKDMQVKRPDCTVCYHRMETRLQCKVGVASHRQTRSQNACAQ